MNLNLNIINTPDGFRRIEAEADALETACSETTLFFSCHAFLQTFIQFVPPNSWFVFEIRLDDGKLVGLVPFAAIKKARPDGSALLGAKLLGDFFWGLTDFLAHPAYRELVVHAVITGLRTLNYGYFEFNPPPVEDGPSNYGCLLNIVPAALREVEVNAFAVSVPCKGELNTFRKGMKKATFADAWRCRRRLSEKGRVEFVTVGAGGRYSIEEGLRLIGKWRQEQFGAENVLGMQPLWSGFLAKLAAECDGKGVLDFTALTLDGRPIAVNLGFLHHGRRHYYFPAYDSEFAMFSPSKVLLAYLIEDAFQRELIFDFGLGRHQYKQDWGGRVEEVRKLTVYFEAIPTEQKKYAPPPQVARAVSPALGDIGGRAFTTTAG